MQRLKRGFQAWRNRTTIRKQLSILVGLAVALSVALLIVFNYVTQMRANEQQQIETLNRVLELENQRLDNYAEELRTFSLQLRSNSGFMNIAAKTSQLTYPQRQDIESAIKTAFYARGDVTEFELYLVRQKQRYAIESLRRKVTLTENVDIEALDGYATFTARPNFCSMTPAQNGLLRFTRTIIDSPRETPLAIVRFTVSMNAVTALQKNHLFAQERLCVFGADGSRYAVASGLTDAETAALLTGVRAGSNSYTTVIGGVENLCVAARESESGFVLVGFKPMSVVNASLIATRNGSIVIGLIALLMTVLLAETFIRYVTAPLSILAHRLRRVGSGNFKTKASLEGSYELIGLSEDVNHMMAGIDSLIERTYVATLNERTAQLVALEAQTNPHFLFNTLQAIGSEAIVRGQNEIYRMVTALGSLLRYSVKGGNLAAFKTELNHVEKYLSLQKARFGNRLVYDIRADSALLPLSVPKLGILSLAENSIVHGLRDQVDCIHIELSGEIDGDNARLTMRDDGCGISPEKLAEIQKTLEDPAVTISQNIGLVNLASRLKLLYNGRARLELTSARSPRLTTVTLIIPLEVLRNVQGVDD